MAATNSPLISSHTYSRLVIWVLNPGEIFRVFRNIVLRQQLEGTLAFCLHLEVAQVGISWNFLQENA